jgi:hypothetical protein
MRTSYKALQDKKIEHWKVYQEVLRVVENKCNCMRDVVQSISAFQFPGKSVNSLEVAHHPLSGCNAYSTETEVHLEMTIY